MIFDRHFFEKNCPNLMPKDSAIEVLSDSLGNNDRRTDSSQIYVLLLIKKLYTLQFKLIMIGRRLVHVLVQLLTYMILSDEFLRLRKELIQTHEFPQHFVLNLHNRTDNHYSLVAEIYLILSQSFSFSHDFVKA